MVGGSVITSLEIISTVKNLALDGRGGVVATWAVQQLVGRVPLAVSIPVKYC